MLALLIKLHWCEAPEREALDSVSMATASLLKGKTGQQLKSVLMAALKIIRGCVEMKWKIQEATDKNYNHAGRHATDRCGENTVTAIMWRIFRMVSDKQIFAENRTNDFAYFFICVGDCWVPMTGRPCVRVRGCRDGSVLVSLSQNPRHLRTNRQENSQGYITFFFCFPTQHPFSLLLRNFSLCVVLTLQHDPRAM